MKLNEPSLIKLRGSATARNNIKSVCLEQESRGRRRGRVDNKNREGAERRLAIGTEHRLLLIPRRAPARTSFVGGLALSLSPPFSPRFISRAEKNKAEKGRQRQAEE